MLRFRILGPVEADDDGVALPIGGPKQRAVLAVLLLNANRAVPISQIVGELWGEHPPDRAVNAVQVYVSNLRRVLERRPDRRLIATRGSAYRLQIDDDSLDLRTFLLLAADGRRSLAASRYADAADRLRSALALFRGPPLADLDGLPFAEVEQAAIEEGRLAATEAAIEADMASGRSADVIGELNGLVGEYPLRERFHGLLAEAYYRTGRQSDALGVFRSLRTLLADELGVDPSPEVRALEQQILAHSQLAGTRRRGRPFLLLHDGTGAQQVVVLDASRSPLTIGRNLGNDVCLNWDPEVSRHHARLEHDAGSWTLVDDGMSFNGTFVDGDRVRDRHSLQDAQVIRVGASVLLYREGGDASTRIARASGATSTALVRSAAHVSERERELLLALAAGRAPGDTGAMAQLHERFDVADLPPDERDAVLLQRARALRLVT